MKFHSKGERKRGTIDFSIEKNLSFVSNVKYLVLINII